MRKFILALLVVIGSMQNAWAQDRVVSGKVSDANGAPIPNASIVVSGGKTGTSTNVNGEFSLRVSNTARTLLISAVNYGTQSILINGNTANATLTLQTLSMDEVVVTGISRVKKSEFTGAVTKITTEQIQNRPVGSFDQLLQGRAPGLLALTGSGQPGSNSTIIIRGTNSISGGSTPLYIIDGIPVESGVFQSLNPNDFASIDILRDAASTALYGSRGSAGIIVITTKRGTGGKMKVTYNGQAGVKSRPDFAFRPMNTGELLLAQENYGKIVGATANVITLPGYYYSPANPRVSTLNPTQQAAEAKILDSIRGINTDWNNEIFRPAAFKNHQISLSGGTGKTRLYSSLAYYNEEGTTQRTDMTRFTSRNNMDYADDNFNFGVSLNLGVTRRNFQQSANFNTSNPFASSALGVPYHKIYNRDGSYNTGIGNKFVVANNFDQTLFDQNYNNQFKGTLGFELGYKITENVKVNLTTGVDFRETQNSNFGSPLVFTRRTSTSITGRAGFQAESLDRFLTGNVRPSIVFRKMYADKHDVEILALGEYVTERAKNFGITGFGADAKRPNTIAALPPVNAVNQLFPVISGFKSANSLMSGLTSIRYTYGGKYTLTGSYRQDGSSKLPEINRWQGFYAVGAVWEATKESFLENSNFVNTLRVRASYGSSGNANNFPRGDYPYQATYTQGNYSGLNTIRATYPGNPDLKWEKTFVANVGVDFELLKNRVYGDVNVYDKRTKDLFVRKNLSLTSGFTAININAGELSNRGVEVNLNVDVLKKSNFTWTVFGNFGYNKNNVEDLGGETSFETGTELITVGKPLGSHYEVKYGGVDAATGQPLYYNAAGVLTNIYNASSRVQDFGTWEAPWKGGFGTRVVFKAFDLSTLFSFQSGAQKFDNLEFFLENPAFLAQGFNQSASLKQWQNPGDVSRTGSPLFPFNFSSNQIHDASFIRFRDLTFAYTFPTSVLANSKLISKMRFYMQGTNLFLFTNWRGRDPEAGATNINISEFPNPRAVTLGLDVTF